MLSSENTYTTASWALLNTPLRALCNGTLRYIEGTYIYIHCVCISGANDCFGEYMYHYCMSPITYASKSTRIYILVVYMVGLIWQSARWLIYVSDRHMSPIRYASKSLRIYIWLPEEAYHIHHQEDENIYDCRVSWFLREYVYDWHMRHIRYASQPYIIQWLSHEPCNKRPYIMTYSRLKGVYYRAHVTAPWVYTYICEPCFIEWLAHEPCNIRLWA